MPDTVRGLWKAYKATQTLTHYADATFDGRLVGTPLGDTFWWGRNVITELYARGHIICGVDYLVPQLINDADTNTLIYRTLMRCTDRTLFAFLKRLNKRAGELRPKVTAL
jgi:hypothetical protein